MLHMWAWSLAAWALVLLPLSFQTMDLIAAAHAVMTAVR